jgi:hypothetical protein
MKTIYVYFGNVATLSQTQREVLDQLQRHLEYSLNKGCIPDNTYCELVMANSVLVSGGGSNGQYQSWQTNHIVCDGLIVVPVCPCDIKTVIEAEVAVSGITPPDAVVDDYGRFKRPIPVVDFCFGRKANAMIEIHANRDFHLQCKASSFELVPEANVEKLAEEVAQKYRRFADFFCAC